MIYLFYSLLFVIAIILQLTIMPLFAIKTIVPDLILIIVLSATMQHGRIFGIVYGFAAGVIFDAFGTGLVGLSSLSNVAAAYIVGILADEKLERRFAIVNGVLLTALLCHDILYFSVLVLGTDISFWNTILRYVFPHTFYTLVFFLIVYLALPRSVWGVRFVR